MTGELGAGEIGIDLVDVSRFRGDFSRKAAYFLSPRELEEYHALSPARRELFLAVRWACKEAIFKATQDPDYTSYTLLHEPCGKPYIAGHPELSVSVSHDGGFVAVVVMRRSQANQTKQKS